MNLLTKQIVFGADSGAFSLFPLLNALFLHYPGAESADSLPFSHIITVSGAKTADLLPVTLIFWRLGAEEP